MISPYLLKPLRSLEQAKKDIEDAHRRCDLAEALEDLDPIDPPKAPVYMLMAPGLVFLGLSIGSHLTMALFS